MRKTFNLNPFYKIKEGKKKVGDKIVKDHDEIELVADVFRFADIFKQRCNFPSQQKWLEYVEPKYGMEYIIFSPYSNSTERRVLTEYDDMDRIRDYVMDGNVYVR